MISRKVLFTPFNELTLRKTFNYKKGLTTFQDIFGFNKTLLKHGGSLIQRETLV